MNKVINKFGNGRNKRPLIYELALINYFTSIPSVLGLDTENFTNLGV